MIAAWAVVQVLDVLSQLWALPDWIAQPITIVLAIGFPITLIVAWMIEGKAHEAVASAVRSPATTVDWVLAGGLAAVIAIFGYQQLSPEPVVVATTNESATEPTQDLSNSIAVLPFGNLSPDPDNAFFTDGMHGELLTQLSKIGSLRVISRTSVMGYRDTSLNMRDIGQELGVTNILEGDVQRVGESVRINVQLINAETDEHLWAEIYDRQLTAENLFAIQSEMATAIAAALQTELLPQEVARLNEVPTQNTRAYDLYLKGNEYYASGAAADLPLAAEMYMQAVEADPEFAVAWAALSRAHASVYWFSIDRTQLRLSLALGAVERAFELAPDLPEAHLAMGDYYYRASRDYARALTAYELAEQGMPGVSAVLESRAYVQRRLGQWDQSIATLSRAIDLDPRNANQIFNQGTTYISLREYDQGDLHYARAAEIAPQNEDVYLYRALIPMWRSGDFVALRSALENAPFDLSEEQYYLGWLAAIYERDYPSAIDILDRWGGGSNAFGDVLIYVVKASLYGVTYQLAGMAEVAEPYFRMAHAQLEEPLQTNLDDPRIYIALGETLAGLGESDAAIQAGRHAMELLPISRDAHWGSAYQLDAIVRVFIPAGGYDAALQELNSHLSRRGGRWSLEGLLPDPRLDPIRDDPRFIALVEQYRRQ